jgi:Mg-chelatase subunit ChlD
MAPPDPETTSGPGAGLPVDGAPQRAGAALLRWRLVLGPLGGAGSGAARAGGGGGDPIWEEAEAALAADPTLQGMDEALDFLYGDGVEEDGRRRGGGLGESNPYVPTWLGDIRRYFPREVVAFMEREAIDRLGLKELLLEPETLQTLEKDVNLVATILAFKHLMPEVTRQTARQVVAEIVEELRRRLENQVRQSLLGALRRDRHSPLKVARNLDVRRTVREGLRHYQPALGKVIPERVYFYANQRRYHEWRVIMLVDQSGSMGQSVVYAGIIGAVFASLPALDTRLVFWDTRVFDVSDQLSDPVELLFGLQAGGGTDGARALRYGASLISEPEKTLLIYLSDLYEGAGEAGLLREMAALKESRARVLCVLALNDSGRASFDRDVARKVAALGIPTFAATPDKLVEAVEQALGAGGERASDV